MTNTHEFDFAAATAQEFRRGLPLHGALDPSSFHAGTTPGSFAAAADIGGPRSFSSPDTPGMPLPSDRTAWDFLPPGWRIAPRSGR